MKRILYLCCLIGLAACNNNKPKATETYSATPTGLQGIQQTTANTSAPNSGQTTGSAGALNPAHGAPGHRCDIAVGAPLNSSSAQTQASVPVQQQIIPNQAATTAPTSARQVTQPTTKATTTPAVPMHNDKGQKLNPEHGKPGHKCEIPVGAPLT